METMTKLTFTVEKMYRLPDAGNLKAFADIAVNDALVIKGVRILDGKKGLFVSMPQEQGKDNRWYDQVVFKSAEVYDAFSTVVIEHYKAGNA
jgi:stage V sporulation protein G